jgi:post-segregation antitoxin (ccd killing protein)
MPQPFTSSATFSAAENQTAIGTVTATDADGDSLTYSISGSEINISSSGVLTFASAPDYETKSSYTATVTVSDGTASVTQDITVNVTDVTEVTNQAPVITSSATFSAAENQTAIGTVTAIRCRW